MRRKKTLFKIRRRRASWQVDCGIINGERKQRSFKTKEAAEEWAGIKANELANNRVAVFELSDKHRMDALEAYRSFSTTLGVDVESLPSASMSLKKAVEFYLAHTKPEGGQRTVSEVKQEYLQAKLNAGRRQRTLQDLRHRMGRFAKDFGDIPISMLSTANLEDWLNKKKYKGITRKNYRTHLVSFFNFAKKHKHVSENVAEGLEVPSLDETTPKILTVSECEKLMKTAATHEPAMVPYFAVALFAGLRPAEAALLDWKNVNFNTKLIKVVPETAKKRRLRFIEMSDNLIAWLAPYRQESGLLTYIRKRFDHVRRKAKVTWSNDVLRHSYGSYHLAMHENAAKTSLEMGHRDTNLLFNHYRDVVMHQDAEKFWNIRPSEDAQIIRLNAVS